MVSIYDEWRMVILGQLCHLACQNIIPGSVSHYNYIWGLCSSYWPIRGLHSNYWPITGLHSNYWPIRGKIKNSKICSYFKLNTSVKQMSHRTLFPAAFVDFRPGVFFHILQKAFQRPPLSVARSHKMQLQWSPSLRKLIGILSPNLEDFLKRGWSILPAPSKLISKSHVLQREAP